MAFRIPWGLNVTEHSSENIEHFVYGVHPKGRLASFQFGDEARTHPSQFPELSLGKVARHSALPNEFPDP
jgi:hypothetical protein